MTLLEFEGRVVPDTGQLSVVATPVRVAAPTTGGGLRTVHQASVGTDWCVPLVVADGVLGTNPDDSLELYTVAGEAGVALPFQPIPTGCARTAIDPAYALEGISCVTVAVRNFYSLPLRDVHAEISEWTGDQALHGAYQFPDGTGAAPPLGINAPQDQFGLWAYGDLGVRGAPDASATAMWTFRYASNAADYGFRGRVLARIDQTCTAGRGGADTDCDGHVDEGCGEFAAGAVCRSDADCLSASCDERGLCT